MEDPVPFPQPFQKLGSQTNPGVTPQCPPAQLRYSVPLHTTFPLPSPLAETILNTQRRVFWAQEPQGAFISGDVGKQAGGVGVGTGVCSIRILTHSYAGDTRAASSLARSNCAVPRAHMNPTSAENTKTVHVGEQPPWYPSLPDGRVRSARACQQPGPEPLGLSECQTAPAGYHSTSGVT